MNSHHGNGKQTLKFLFWNVQGISTKNRFLTRGFEKLKHGYDGSKLDMWIGRKAADFQIQCSKN